MRRWEDVEMTLAGTGIPAPMAPVEGCAGFCMVFESLEDLHDVYPDVLAYQVITMEVQDG